MSNNNNPLTEIGAIVLAGLLVIGAALLMWAGKISFTDLTLMITFALALFGGNLALKAPSPAQQAQLGQLTQQVLSVLPAVVTATQQPAVPAQPAPSPFPAGTPNTVTTNTVTAGSVPQVQFVPDPNVPMAAFNTAQMPAVVPPQAK
jgi:hypothetical protein